MVRPTVSRLLIFLCAFFDIVHVDMTYTIHVQYSGLNKTKSYFYVNGACGKSQENTRELGGI